MLSELARCIHMRQIFESAKVILLLVVHFWEDTAPNALVKVRVISAPSNSPQGPTDIFTVAYKQAVAATSRVTNNCTAHARAETCHSVILPLDCILIWIVVEGV